MRLKAVALGAAALMGGMGGSLVLSLVRNVVLARLLGPEQFGLAVTLLMVITLIEASTDIGLDRFLVQSRREADPREQRTAQFLIAIRGVLIAAALYGLAPFAAPAFGAPEATGPLRLLAIAPLIGGLAHLDQKRFQRQFRFAPQARSTLFGEAAGLAVAAALAFHWRSYEAMSWALVARVAATTLSSHWQAERRYGWSVDHVAVREMLTFGWPLILNGIVIFVSSQIDRIVVATQIGSRELGIYSAASTFVSAPGLLATRISNSLAHPIVVAARDDADRARQGYRALGIAFGLTAALFVAGFGLIGPDLVRLLFGAAYDPVPGLMSLLAAAFGFRLFRVWPTVAALVENDPRSVLYANLCRLVGIPLAFLALPLGWGVSGVALALATGELLATVFATRRLSLRRPLLAKGSGSILPCVAAAIAAIAAAETQLHTLGLPYRLALVVVLATASAATAWHTTGRQWWAQRKGRTKRSPGTEQA